MRAEGDAKKLSQASNWLYLDEALLLHEFGQEKELVDLLSNKMNSCRVLCFIQLKFTQLINYINVSHTPTSSLKCAKFLAIKTCIDRKVEAQSEYLLGNWELGTDVQGFHTTK